VTEYKVVDGWTANGEQVVAISGEIDLTNAIQVRDAISHIASPDATSITVDLTETTYLDSSGIAILFHLSERLNDRRQELRVVVPPTSPLRTALELTNLPRTIPVRSTLG
jgi:anti-sigma B factor antagonist